MSYKLRNTLVLAAFLTVILIFDGYFIVYSHPSTINNLNKEIGDLQRQIQSLEGVEDQFQILQNQIREKEKQLANLDKAIASEVTSARTYYYLNQILQKIGFLEFNLLYTGTQVKPDFGYNTYNIKGEGPFSRIFEFVWHIDRGPEIYRITKLSLHGVESRDPETQKPQLVVPFEMELRGYFAHIEGLPTIRRTLYNVRTPKRGNPFYPYVRNNLPPNTDNLVEIERAELKAIVPGKALIADFNGKIHAFQEGDRVYLGYLTKIDTEKNQAVFTLNKGGIYEKFILNLRFDNTNDGK